MQDVVRKNFQHDASAELGCRFGGLLIGGHAYRFGNRNPISFEYGLGFMLVEPLTPISQGLIDERPCRVRVLLEVLRNRRRRFDQGLLIALVVDQLHDCANRSGRRVIGRNRIVREMLASLFDRLAANPSREYRCIPPLGGNGNDRVGRIRA